MSVILASIILVLSDGCNDFLLFHSQANNTGGPRHEEPSEIFASGTIVRSSTPDEGGSIPGTPEVKQEAREDSATNLAEVHIYLLLYQYESEQFSHRGHEAACFSSS